MTDNKLKFEGLDLGAKIKAYDFKPFTGREECFIEGTIVRVDDEYYKGYIVECVYDSWNDREEAGNGNVGRVGSEVKVPFQISSLSEFDERITVIETFYG